MRLPESVDYELLYEIATLPAHELNSLVIKNLNNKSSKYNLTNLLNHFHRLKTIEKNEHLDLVEVFYNRVADRISQLQELNSKDKLNAKSFPLLGYFLSVKDSLRMKNTQCTGGFLKNLGKLCPENGKTLKQLINDGVLITSKGNVPQAMFSYECFNHIFGEGKNPYNKGRTPGGSSGGEGAIVRLGLANVGLGSDIAGSLRIPALFNGICTLKSTALRLSLDTFTGYFEFADGKVGETGPCFDGFLLPSIGPMARCVEDVEVMMERMVASIKGDLMSPPMPWKRVTEMPKRIGVMKAFDMVELSPAN